MTTGIIIGLIVIIVLIVLLGEPLYVLIGAVAVYCLLGSGVLERFDLLSTSIIGETRGLADNPVLLAIPFFVIAGALMTEGDIAKRLIEFAKAMFGWMPGGLAVAAVVACIIFAAISGSSPVTVIAIGTIMYPALVKERYPDKFANGLVTSAGSLGILIPPSIPMIVYAIVDPTQFADPPGYTLGSGGGNTGVKDLFLAGMGPGLLIGLALGGYAIFTGLKHKVPRMTFSLKRLGETFVHGFWALMLPVLILGGIYSGLFSPTQAAAVSVVYAFVVELWVHESIKLEDLPRIFVDCAVLIGTLLVIFALALGFNRYLELAQVPEAAVEMIKEWELSLFTFLIIINILLLIVGCLMDILSAILILVPLLAAVGAGLGVHPLHLAIIFIVNLEIGYLTPPVGLNLFVSSSIFRKPLGEVIRAVVPFLLLMGACLILITYIPTISLGPVSLLKGQDFVVSFPEQEDTSTGPGGDDDEEMDEAVGSELDSLMDEVEEEEEGVGSELDALMDEVEEEMEEEEEEDEPEEKKTPGSELDEMMDEVEEEMAEEEEEEEGEAPQEEPTPDGEETP